MASFIFYGCIVLFSLSRSHENRVKQSQNSSKIFGIGLSKTGTNSLTLALQFLGYSAIHYPTNLQQIEAHDAATDISVTASFEKLDGLFSGSKFILTGRDLEEWLTSSSRHNHKRQSNVNAFALNVQKQLYGTLDYDRELFVQAYERHSARVRSYFSERPNDLLCINVCNDLPTWEPLYHFLEKPIPDSEFPWTNRTSITDQLLIRLFDHFRDVRLVAQISGVNQD